MPGRLEDIKVLIVDDDRDVRESMDAAFQAEGAMTQTAGDGNTAVRVCMDDPPDLVVLDMMLPGRSGFLVLEKIKARKPRNAPPHIIMITGNPGARHKMYAESLGVSEYFTKPVKMDKLIATAERLVGGTTAAAS